MRVKVTVSGTKDEFFLRVDMYFKSRFSKATTLEQCEATKHNIFRTRMSKR